MSEFKEAVVLIAKCGESHKSYGIRMEKTGTDRWLTTWAFPIKDSSAKREGYDKIQVKGDISFSDDYPGCPYCGGHGLTLCPCGHLSCTIMRSNVFTCEWCGMQGDNVRPVSYTHLDVYKRQVHNPGNGRRCKG